MTDDGSMTVAKKEVALDKIRRDPSYTIILIRFVSYFISLVLDMRELKSKLE